MTAVDQDSVILSTNIELRLDGLPYSNRRSPEDVGAAVYFSRNDKNQCIAVDKYDRVADNISAIAKAVKCLRSLERYGADQVLERAFVNLNALPAPEQKTTRSWRSILGGYRGNDINEVQKIYRKMRSAAHQDNGGRTNVFHQVQEAWDSAQRELGS